MTILLQASLFLGLAVLSMPSATAEPAPAEVVGQIRFQADGPVTGISVSDLEKLLLLRQGEGFSEVLARASVRRIYATELFHDVQIESRSLPDDPRIEVIIRLIRRYLLRRIRFEGEVEVSGRILRRELTIREGEAFSQAQVEESRERIRLALTRRGYFDPNVELDWEIDRDLALIDVIFRITPGRPARVRQLAFDLEGPLTQTDLAGILQTRVGGIYSEETLNEDLERVARHLRLRGYFNPEIYVRDGAEFHDEDGTVSLQLRVVAREPTEVVIRGLELSRRELEALPLFGSRRQTSLRVEDTRLHLLHGLQEDGYFQAEVQAIVEGSEFPPGGVIFEVDRGRKFSLDEIRFEGNTEVSDRELLPVLNSRKAGLITRGYCTDQSMLEDRNRIQLLYQRYGYLEANADSELIAEDGRASLVFRIVEGRRSLVGGIRFEGNQVFSREELLAQVGFREGSPFSPIFSAAGRAALVSLYDRSGFREVRVEPEITRREDDSVDLLFTIEEGHRFEVEDVVVTGNRVTRRRVFDREIPIRSGDPLSLERNLAAETNLYSLSVFNRVRVREIPGQDPANQRLVLFSVQEARRYSLFYGFGYSHSFGSLASEGPRGTFGISDNNFLGMARTLSLNLRAGSRQQRGNLAYNVPRLMGRRLPTVLSFTVDNEERISEDAVARTVRLRGRPYDAFRIIASSQSELVLSRRESLFFRYNFQRIRLGLPTGVEQLLPLFREESRLRLSTLSLSYLNESRDDPTDPHSGFFLNGDLSLAARPIGSERQYLRFLAQGRYYFPLYTDLTLAASLRLGIIEPFGGGTNPVPISERFFAGGSTTLRGLPVDLAGPLLRDPATGEVVLLEDNRGKRFAVPVGGNALVVGNLELRFPVWDRLGGVLFYDAGNVFPSIANLGAGEYSNAAGLGLAIRTPIGPVRLDMAYNPDPPRVEGFKRWNFHINIGHPF